jgi:nucleoside phosphorylase
MPKKTSTNNGIRPTVPPKRDIHLEDAATDPSSAWLVLAKNVLTHCGIAGDVDNALDGIKIWIGVSKSDKNLAAHGALLRNAFQSMGALVIGSPTFSHPFDSEHCAKELRSADVIVMLAATPGVSARAVELCFRAELSKDDARDRMRLWMPIEYQNGYICQLLRARGARVDYLPVSEFTEPVGSLFEKSFYSILDERERVRVSKLNAANLFKPTIGIVTALPIELQSVRFILGENSRLDPRFTGDELQEYEHGNVAAAGGGVHPVVLTSSGKGTNKAAIAATNMLTKYPTIKSIFMVGIAGGVPDLKDASQHVRLGDIVVCDSNGVIQSDAVKYRRHGIEHTPDPRPPSAVWTNRLRGYLSRIGEPKYWEYLDQILNEAKMSRPHSAPLNDSPWLKDVKASRHPADSQRTKGRPKLYQGAIASSNALIRTAKERERLKEIFKVKAFEMEAAGLADAAWEKNVGYFVIRGICDYANDGKNKKWQPYAAAAAAAFTRDFIETMPTHSKE